MTQILEVLSLWTFNNACTRFVAFNEKKVRNVFVNYFDRTSSDVLLKKVSKFYVTLALFKMTL